MWMWAWGPGWTLVTVAVLAGPAGFLGAVTVAVLLTYFGS